MLENFFDKIPYLVLLSGLVHLMPWYGQRFDWFMQLNRKAYFKKPTVLGFENLLAIPANYPLVIVVSHFSDSDLQIVAGELGTRLQKVRPQRLLAMSCQSQNFADIKTSFFIKAAGKQHFFGIDAYFDKNLGRLKFTFNERNFIKMARALKAGTDIIIAAHEPLSNIPDSSWVLPKRSGLGAAYLVQIADALILPVAVDIQTAYPIGMSADIRGAAKRLLTGEKPDVKVVIGSALKLDEIPDEELRLFGPYLKRKSKNSLSEEWERMGEKVFKKIVNDGNTIMKAIASLLPREKRGIW